MSNLISPTNLDNSIRSIGYLHPPDGDAENGPGGSKQRVEHCF